MRCLVLADLTACVGGLPADLIFDVVELADALEHLEGDGRALSAAPHADRTTYGGRDDSSKRFRSHAPGRSDEASRTAVVCKLRRFIHD